MNANFNQFANKTVLRAVKRIVADAVLGAACAALYGFAFGGMGALAQHESHRLLSITSVFALCGGIAGLALGAYSAFSKADLQSSETRSPASDRPAPVTPPIVAAHPLALIAQRQSQSIHAA